MMNMMVKIDVVASTPESMAWWMSFSRLPIQICVFFSIIPDVPRFNCHENKLFEETKAVTLRTTTDHRQEQARSYDHSRLVWSVMHFEITIFFIIKMSNQYIMQEVFVARTRQNRAWLLPVPSSLSHTSLEVHLQTCVHCYVAVPHFFHHRLLEKLIRSAEKYIFELKMVNVFLSRCPQMETELGAHIST